MTFHWVLTTVILFSDLKGSKLAAHGKNSKFESKLRPLPNIWQSFPKDIPEDNQRFWGQSQWQRSWGSSSGTAWAAQMSKYKHRVFPRLLQPLLASRGLLEKTMLPLVLFWFSSRVKKVFMLCKFWLWLEFFFSCEMKFSMEPQFERTCYQIKQHS